MVLSKQEGFEGQLLFRLTADQIEHAKNDPVHSSLYLTDIGYYPHAPGHLVERPQGSPSNILVHCISGSGLVKIGGEEYTVCEGEFFVIPSGVAHRYRSQIGWRIFWVHFDGYLAFPFMRGLMGGGGFLPKKEPERELAIGVFRDLLKHISQSMSLSSLSYLHFSLSRLLGIYSLSDMFSESGAAYNGGGGVIAYMKENISGQLTLTEMADYAELSVSRFSQLFKEQTGHSPVDYYIRLKVQRASQLLTSTALKVNEIAALCGWDNPFYFSRSFKQITGSSPKFYRKQFHI